LPAASLSEMMMAYHGGCRHALGVWHRVNR
jgi:hypothetical protein